MLITSTGIFSFSHTAFTSFNLYFICGPSKTISTPFRLFESSSTGIAHILLSIPVFFASFCIFVTNKLVDIPAAQHNNIFFITLSPQIVNFYIRMAYL